MPSPILPEKRRFVRVPFRRGVQLSSHDAATAHFAVVNLSQGGMYLEGAAGLDVGTDCRIEFQVAGPHVSFLYRVNCTIAHQDNEGFGVRFTGMEDECFMFVQTMVLYGTDDPLATAEQFVEEFAAIRAAQC